ncbi:MAG TPA: YbhB/YbcL family Raf kinase inhibitor-like protein [Chitinophagaceae bacterium]|nr:YbhB/YbcL family Raf kinase inhibitor-like protein [Chitinophagaceae bacterium]
MQEKINNSIKVRSSVFSHGGHIPMKYTCEGENVNPPLEFDGLPENTRSLALIVEDPDAPKGVYDHWLLWNISPQSISENSSPGTSGRNSFGNTGYGGPCPPSGSHRYFFKVYALDIELDLKTGADKKLLLEAMKDHLLGSGEIMAHYQKKK